MYANVHRVVPLCITLYWTVCIVRYLCTGQCASCGLLAVGISLDGTPLGGRAVPPRPHVRFYRLGLWRIYLSFSIQHHRSWTPSLKNTFDQVHPPPRTCSLSSNPTATAAHPIPNHYEPKHLRDLRTRFVAPLAVLPVVIHKYSHSQNSTPARARVAAGSVRLPIDTYTPRHHSATRASIGGTSVRQQAPVDS